jgi:hypothetical protein
MKDEKHHSEMKLNAIPINTGTTRNVPEPVLQILKTEIDNQTEQNIIRPLNKATPWLHSMVIVNKKGGGFRLCVDFRRINEQIVRPTNPQQTPWEIVRTLPKGIKYFAVFDAFKGYHQVELDEASQELTAFMTPFGRYCYNRFPMGLTSAGDVFTLLYGNAIDPVTDSRRCIEDTLITANTTTEHLEKTKRFFETCRTNGITLNLKKIQWDQREVIFGGILLSAEDYQPDPKLNTALSHFPTPKNLTDMLFFLGLANQLCNFSDGITKILAPLKPLHKKSNQFMWLPEHEEAFSKVKQYLSSGQTLAYYNPKLKTRLSSDASRLNGPGFVLKQKQSDGNWKPVQAGSRFLTTAEVNYAMVKLELLCIVWATVKCQMFIEGLPKEQLEI